MRDLLDRYLRHRFAWLFVSLLVTIGLNPLFDALFRFDPLEGLLALNLAAAIGSAARERWLHPLLALAVVMGVARGTSLQAISHLVWLTATLLAAVTSARHAVRPGPIGSEHLFAALNTYLLAGLAFGVGYSLLDEIRPDSFAGADALGLSRGIYFSFVTLATLGYGDIVPASDIARGVAILEAVLGQLYLAVLVARLVGLYGGRWRS